MKNITLILLLICSSIFGWAQANSTSFNVLNPRIGNGTKTPAYFKSIEMTITPAGTYANVDVVLEISAQHSNLQNSNDSLEIEYKFSLPEGSLMHEAWLWMFGIPVKGEMYERNKARLIYEALVARRVDPLIMYQNENNTYEARVFPINNPNARKMRMSFLVPIRSNAKGIEVPMPLSIFKQNLASSLTPNIKITIPNNTQWGQPSTLQNATNTSLIGNNTVMNLLASDKNLNTNVALYFKQPTTQNFFITQLDSTGTSGYYQLMISPTVTAPGNKYIYVIDYVQHNNVSFDQVIQSLKSKMLYELQPTDSFNIFYTKNSSFQAAANTWLPANDASILNAFSAIPSSNSNTNGQTLPILNSAVNFINNHGESGNIFMISNGPSLGTQISSINQLVNLILGNRNKNYPITVYDFNDYFSYSIYSNLNRFYNNEYFLKNVSLLSGGEYFNRRTVAQSYYNAPILSYANMLNTAFNFQKTKTTYDVISYSYNGVLANEYKLPSTPFNNVGDAYMETGRLINPSGSLNVNYYYGVGNANYSQTNTLYPTVATDTFTRKIWAGNYINHLTDNNSNNAYTNTIINASMEFEVLSNYTAFLALEPDTISGTITNDHPTGITDIEKNKDVQMNVYPNPFTSHQTLEMNLDPSLANEEWTLDILDITGRTLKSLHGKVGYNHKVKVKWMDESFSLPKGVYLLKFSIGNVNRVVRVIRK